jgi:GNAT superfamily N-acetyltransferase
MDSLQGRIASAFVGWHALGHEVADAFGARFVRSPSTPRIYDANFVSLVSAGESEVDAIFDEAERRFAGLAHRHAVTGPATPQAFLARLALERYRPDPTLQLVLSGALLGPEPGPFTIRPVDTDADWTTCAAFRRLDMDEGRARAGDPPHPPVVSEEMTAALRAKSPAVHFCFAAVEGRDVACFSSWVGPDALGLVENLFTHPDYRRRGIARALIHHCVAACREAGAREVLIGADPSDTPMQLYAAMGFRPTCLTWSWVKAPVGV